jgi:hypothetical protein
MTDSLDAALARAKLPVTPEDHERLARTYPIVQSWQADVRIPVIRYTEPAIVFRAEPGDYSSLK